MTADALAVIDTYTTALTWAEHGWNTALTLLAATSACAVIRLGRLVFDRIGASFTRAQQTITDIQTRQEES